MTESPGVTTCSVISVPIVPGSSFILRSRTLLTLTPSYIMDKTSGEKTLRGQMSMTLNNTSTLNKTRTLYKRNNEDVHGLQNTLGQNTLGGTANATLSVNRLFSC